MKAGEGIIVAGSLLLIAAAAWGVDYDVVVLDPNAACIAVSDGKLAGCVETADPKGERHQHAAIWRDATRTMVDLNPKGCVISQVWDASGGRQVGMGDNHALLWSGIAESVVDLNPAGCEYSCAYGVWNNRQAGVGMSQSSGEHALLWSGTAQSVVDLHPADFTISRAGGVWNGFQVGYGVPLDGGETDWRALLWFGTSDSVVNLHPDGFRRSCACDAWGIWQVGSGVPADSEGMQALLWSGMAESVVNLHPDGYRWSYAVRCWGGRQVGVGDDHALLWSGSAQSVVDLHRFVPAEYTWSGAFGIDSTGRIAGYVGNDSGKYAAVWVPRWTPVYRLWSPRRSGCLYTIQGAEVESLMTDPNNAWIFEGIFCHVPPDSLDPNAMPVYRFKARDGPARFYTIDRAERDKFFRDQRDAWTSEGIAFYAYRPSRRPSSAIAVHRFRSDSQGSYFYTRDEHERASLMEPNSGWIYEGVAWYACE
jgi:hypothetical protein